jgi:phage recombination protein Bet
MSIIEHSTPVKADRRSVVRDMAERYGMEPDAFEATLRATIIPKDSTKEQFAAFLLVAKEYNLNPMTKEIYAFPSKGGGIQPIVSIDGWINLANSHPMFDGMEFDDHVVNGELLSITAVVYRRDRRHPVKVTEYMHECKGTSEPWRKWPSRMLRHKAAIQCIRYAFGFSGIMEPDEFDRMIEVEQSLSVDQKPVVSRTVALTQKLSAKAAEFSPIEPVYSGLTDEEKEAILKAEATQS